MLPFLGVVFAAIAACAALRTASETRRMVQASVILQIRQQVDQLRSFDKKLIAQDFDLESETVDYKDSNETIIYKEMIINYYKVFYNLMLFITTNTIDKDIVNKMVISPELEAFLKIIKQLEAKLDVLTERSAFDFWENFRKKHVNC
jgi:hypothetical protein